MTHACAKAAGIGDEGGFAPPIVLPEEALDLLQTAVAGCGYAGKIKYTIDPASSEFFHDDRYEVGFKQKTPNVLSPVQLGQLYQQLIAKYPRRAPGPRPTEVDRTTR